MCVQGSLIEASPFSQPPVPGVCWGGSLVEAPPCAQLPHPRVCAGGSLIDAPPFSQSPVLGVCWGVSGGSGAAGGRKSDESLGACAAPPHPLWALAGSTSLRAGMRREAPGTERQVSLGAQSSPERSASGSQGGPPEGSGSRKASDTGLGPSRVHLPHSQVVTVEVTLSLALSLAPSASPGGQAFPEQARDYILLPLEGGASYCLGGPLGEVWGC